MENIKSAEGKVKGHKSRVDEILNNFRSINLNFLVRESSVKTTQWPLIKVINKHDAKNTREYFSNLQKFESDTIRSLAFVKCNNDLREYRLHVEVSKIPNFISSQTHQKGNTVLAEDIRQSCKKISNLCFTLKWKSWTLSFDAYVWLAESKLQNFQKSAKRNLYRWYFWRVWS